VAALWQQYYTRENGGRTRENGEKNGQHGVSMKIHVKMSRESLSFREGREGRKRDPLACITSVTPKEGSSLKGEGHTMREGELPLGEETQKMGEETPSPKFKPFSNAPRGHPRCGMGPHVVPITKWPIQWRW
jgi:hypothetical protein